MSADRTPSSVRPFIPDKWPKDYVSGAIISYPYSQTYGYFELSGRIPAGRGLWPAFWLLPANLSWPPENDVMEVLGDNPDVLYTTMRSTTFTKGMAIGHATHSSDLSFADHRFGVDWGPERVRYYLDRRLVFSQPTP